jgi:hypothetical protein
MDNILSSVLQGLNSYHQRTRIDKDSLLNGKIVVFNSSDPDANTALVNATTSLVSAYPNPSTYEILDVYLSSRDGSQTFAYIIIRLN